MKAMRAMLSVLAALFALSTAGPGVHGAQRASAAREPIPATDVTAADIQATLKQQVASSRPVVDTPIRVVDAGALNVGIGLVYRLKSATAASHDKVSEVYHVIEGAGTLVTGGMLVNPQRRENLTYFNQLSGPGVTGTRVQGGVSRRLAKGDVVIIPAGTPHWWSEIQAPLTYLVVRIDPGQLLTLK